MRLSPSLVVSDSPNTLHHESLRLGLHLCLCDSPRYPGPLMRCLSESHSAWLSFSFGPSPVTRLLRPLLTSRVRPFDRCPFGHKARSPQVRTRSFTTQPPDLHDISLTTKASRCQVRSPRQIVPCIRFLSIGSWFRSTLPPHVRSPLRSCASLRSLWPAYGRTFTSEIAPMLGAPKPPPAKASGFKRPNGLIA